MEENLKKIINIAILAPSGDNSQPWKFVIKKNAIWVYNAPEKDTSLYNFNMYASMVAIGALLENIKITATHFNYSVEIKINENLFQDHVATCIFNGNETKEDELFKYIKKRVTNRKVYKNNKLNKELINKLLDLNCEYSKNLGIKVITEDNLIKKLANASSVNEQIVLENKKLHSFLFGHITWTEEEDSKKKGFYIKTLELKRPQRLVFKILSSWKINNFLNKLGISKFIAKDNARLYSKSGAMLAITTNILNRDAFLKTGMLMQKIWLIATQHNIYLQPLTGIIFLNHRINNNNNKEEFSDRHINLIKKSYKKMEEIIIENGRFITTMFRLGYADKPSTYTKRQEAYIELER